MKRRTFLLAGAAARGAAGQGIGRKNPAGKTRQERPGGEGPSRERRGVWHDWAVGTLYASSLEVMPQSFTQGFPGITDRREWFAIDYRAKVWIARPGLYRFALLSDDGAKFWINEKLVIDNDGVHAPLELAGSARPPGEAWSVFHTDRYVAPAAGEHPAGEVAEIKRASNW